MTDPDDICPKTKVRHIPDWQSTKLEWDGDTLYVDVNCRDCGKSGCVGTHLTLAETICW